MKTQWKARRALLAALTGLTMIAAGCGADEPADPAAPVPLTFVKCGAMNPGTTADAAIPVAMGYWEAENLDVDLPSVSGSSECVQGIDAGTFEVAAIGATGVLIAAAAGAPLKAIAAYVNANIWFPFVPADSPIRSVQDLKGKIVGVPTLESGAVPMFKALLESEGLTVDDVELVAAGTGAQVVALFEENRIAAYAASTSHAAPIQPNFALRKVSNPQYDSIGFHIPIVAHEKVVAEKRAALVGLLRGIFKSMVFAEANPQAAVAMHYKVWPDTRPTGKSADQIIAEGVNSLKARLAEFQQVDGLWGNCQPDVHLRSHVQMLINQGSVDLNASEIDAFTGKLWEPGLLAEANDFDADAVRSEARAINWRDYMS